MKKKYAEEVVGKLMTEFTYSNKMEVPKILKVVLNRGFGKDDVKAVDNSGKVMSSITGQKVRFTKAKHSISNFGIREKQVIGAMVTLRGCKMWDFLTKLFRLL